ncbi:PREDICTED: LIM domain only protein 7 isoform X2 [Nicrophorus vespilloides]|uniref:LIM domain only protein 7 isoform X2 n=1 Tax=Nicrophorus vespilloides TaxID=110193 RepID=A0ABM1M5D7_NICVS|nr:PREDICTED: LIM domain only protein 7 isoform X2 [Nicrophorus vespilloides]
MGVNTDLEDLATNTEYSATKCRITKPPPPKPAANPMQFVKVGPCPLFKKAAEQIKKVEEVKQARQEVREEAEDWQHNLDNWKSSRRKRQEHIIERVEEVKKLEQQEHDRSRRKSTTFHEIVEKRSRGRPKLNYPLYEDDSNDLSDYGIGSSSSKTNSIKDVDTDDNSSVLDDNPGDSACKYHSSASNQSQSEDEQKEPAATKNPLPNSEFKVELPKPEMEQYTYEGAIQDYRSRIRTKINMNNDAIFAKPLDASRSKEFSEAQQLLPKGNLFKKRELFDKGSVEMSSFESNAARRISEDFANSQSIKERLQSLEKCVDQPAKAEKDAPPVPVKSRVQSFIKPTAAKTETDNYLLDVANCNATNKPFESNSNTEDDMFIDKLNMFNKDLDDFISYPPSASFTDLMTMSSDREDSGIHTSDISCSISQSDEAFEDTDVSLNTIPKCIEKLSIENVYEKEMLSPQKEAVQPIEEPPAAESPIVTEEKVIHCPLVENIEKNMQEQDKLCEQVEEKGNVIYENVDVPNYNYPLYIDDIFEKTINPPKMQPPSEKPPPPPISDVIPDNVVTRPKSIKKEISIKRSSFLGLEEPEFTDDDITFTKPPDINTFLQNESRMEKSLYKKMQGSMGSLNTTDDADLKRESWISNNSFRQTIDQPEEDEITKKEREIIELVEKEEKSRDNEYSPTKSNYNVLQEHPHEHLGSKKFDIPYFPETQFKIDGQDSEVLKVEHELLQLEREELERQRENMAFRKKLMQNHHSYENIFDVNYSDSMEHRQSMPELQLEFRKAPHVKHIDYRKSMPDIQHSFNRSLVDYSNPPSRSGLKKLADHRKSMSDLHPDKSSFQTTASHPPKMPTKFFNPLTKDKKDRLMHVESDAFFDKTRPYSKPTLHALSAPPKQRSISNDNWIQPKSNPEAKSYNQHWLFQEAELRRISEQKSTSSSHEKQKAHNKGFIDCNPAIRMPDLQKEYNQHKYLGHPQTALSMPYSTPAPGVDEGQDVMLSVSGKKKCSYCGIELGRGAAMIIESLCLFYHMECFKCCVCHMQLGDGLMGTDVRVRNQKLHCHNCYSSDDGIKFSCV